MPAANEVLAVEFDHYGGPEVLQLRRIAPPQPAPNEVLIQVHAASMNPVDWKVRSGMLQKFFPVTFPAITGRDGAGEVIAVGSGCRCIAAGQAGVLSGVTRRRHVESENRSGGIVGGAVSRNDLL